jgi:hypothetical protein
MTILVAKIVPQETWLYSTIVVNFCPQKFLMLRTMTILVAKIVPQETWLYSKIVVNFCTKNSDATDDGHSCGKNRAARNMALLQNSG